MAFMTWQVGLDIQNGQLCALAVQRRRNGWQLRHWWQHALPHDTLTDGQLQRSEVFTTLLQRFRKQLPYRVSLRVGFPPQLVLQRKLEVTRQQLREPHCGSYIYAAAKRFFPVEPETLTLDYRQPQQRDDQLWLTATRREALQGWLHCLHEADLSPQVLELTPTALFVLAKNMRLDPGAVLVHRLYDHWLWCCPFRQPNWGCCSLQDAPDFTSLRRVHLPDVNSFYYSAIMDTPLPEGARWLNPLAVLAHMQPPLPINPGAFTLAAGLALRPGDA
ncbi:pilus assembly protein PilM [Erwinia psidii]|uniref:Pilus assembly protein n=1 Tax=Erwinia psidii TaxID=69224 RepID=A0A3N6RXG7_9GAMM|nr:pilus assembly protein PilM [Erwinia psidii]MCX8958871.1 pilus assembly protein [Erwinia psidii]MCX8961943.1 pilus assembly protein [Erwinia psidii]MCX8966208.1 pilus assembly protein [Erwinia psidii]RQM37798.1 pilus assembly protein [Erwinia psidii]